MRFSVLQKSDAEFVVQGPHGNFPKVFEDLDDAEIVAKALDEMYTIANGPVEFTLQ